jgi:hypothetical protein
LLYATAVVSPGEPWCGVVAVSSAVSAEVTGLSTTGSPWPLPRTAPHLNEHGMKPVALVPLEIERQVQPCDRAVLKLQRAFADYPADISVLGHPGRARAPYLNHLSFV